MHAHLVALKLWHMCGTTVQLAKLLACRMVATVARVAAYRAVVQCNCPACTLLYTAVCHGHGCGHASYFNYDSRPRGWRAVSKSVSQSASLSVCPCALSAAATPWRKCSDQKQETGYDAAAHGMAWHCTARHSSLASPFVDRLVGDQRAT